jgi:hypothetical protein
MVKIARCLFVGGKREARNRHLSPTGIWLKKNYRRTFKAAAKVEESSSASAGSHEREIEQGLARAVKTLRNVRSAWVEEQQVHGQKS